MWSACTDTTWGGFWEKMVDGEKEEEIKFFPAWLTTDPYIVWWTWETFIQISNENEFKAALERAAGDEDRIQILHEAWTYCTTKP